MENGGSWGALERAGLALMKDVRSANEGERSSFEVALSRMRTEGDDCFALNPSIVSQVVRAIQIAATDGIAFDQLRHQSGCGSDRKVTVILNRLVEDASVVECCNDRGRRVFMSRHWFDLLKRRRAEKAAERRRESEANVEALCKEIVRNLEANGPNAEPAGLDYWLEDADPKAS